MKKSAGYIVLIIGLLFLQAYCCRRVPTIWTVNPIRSLTMKIS